MKRQAVLGISPILIATLALLGCAAPTTSGSDGSGSDGSQSSSGGASGASGGESHATVTVDGETWDYSNFMCAFGYEQTDSDEYSFSATSFKTSDGEKVQFLIDVSDPSGQDRLEGDGVSYEIHVSDYGNIDNPTIALDIVATSGVTISDKTVTVFGKFTGLDGDSHVVEAEAACR